MSQQSGHDCRGVWRKHCWLAGQAGGIQDSHESDAAPWNAAESAMATLSADEDEFDIAEDRGGGKLGKGRVGQSPSAGPPGSGSLRPALQGGARRRRTRCRRCEACVRSECGECTFCKDMKKFGGPGKMKQSCIQRQCYAPILPHTAVCRVCGEAGKEDTAEGDEERFNISLMECSICNEIVHPACIKVDDTEGVINDELPNCWECPKCNQEGKTGKKRGPGFKYASSLPGSMLREAVGSLGGSAGERRRSDDLSRRRMDDEESSEGFQEDGNDDRLLGSGESAVDTDDGAEADADGPEHLSDVSGTPSPPLLPPAQPNHTMVICRKGQEDGLVNKRRRDGEAAAPLGQRKKQIKLEKAEKLMRRKKRKAMDVNGRTESDDRGEMPEDQDKSLGTDLNQSWGRDILGMGGSGKTTGRNAAGPSFRDEAIRERRPNAKWPRDPERTKPCTAQAKDNARPALWGLQHSEPHPGGRGWGPCDWDGSANGSRREDEEDAGLGENGSRTPRLFSSNELLQKAAKTLNGTTRGTSRPPDQLSCSRQTAMPLRLCGNTRLGGLPRPPTSVSPPKPHLLERHVIKPPLVSPPPDSLPLADGGSHPLRHEVWVSIFRHLSHRDLCLCMRVCKTWNRWCCDRRLWTRLDLSKCKAITPLMLSGIIRRQPLALDLSWSNVSKKQLAWLVNRLPGLQELIVCGCPWVAVSGLCSASLPPLHALDLRWAEGVRDAHLRDLLAADSDYSTGSDGRLRSVRELRLAGLEISDAALPLLVLHAPSLHTLDLSHCGLLTDRGLDLLSAPGTSTQQSLRQLILTGCVRITDACLPLLARCAVLERLDLRSCRLVSPDACLRFVAETVPHGIFSLPEERLIERAHCGRNATVACTTVGS